MSSATFEPTVGMVALGSAVLSLALLVCFRRLAVAYDAGAPGTRRAADAGLLFLLWATCALAVAFLWRTWQMVVVHPDTFGYLTPTATAMADGSWHHAAGRSFIYPAFAYLALRSGNSLNIAVAVQLFLYVAAAPLLYATLCSSTRERGLGFQNLSPDTFSFISRLIALATVVLYFSISNEFLATAFYLGPELLASFLSLLAVYFCIQLLENRTSSPKHLALIALGSSLCSALLIGLKPALTVLALWILIISGLSVIRQQAKLSRPIMVGILVSMLAIPTGTVWFDALLASKYGDTNAILFGPRTAFCNNADIVASALDLADSPARRLLGEEGTQEISAFVRDALSRTDEWPLLGYYGDYCSYGLSERRVSLEQKYFGNDPRRIANTYNKLLLASVYTNLGAYIQRVARQMREFVFYAPPVDCEVVTRHHFAHVHSPHVTALLDQYLNPQTRTILPQAPLGLVLCSSLGLLAGPSQGALLIFALMAMIANRIQKRTESPAVAQYRRRLILCSVAWISAAVIVAMVHTFDLTRYITVTFPLFLLTLGSSAIYLTAWVWQLKLERGLNEEPGGRSGPPGKEIRSQTAEMSSPGDGTIS